jgi:hypothetical protein
MSRDRCEGSGSYSCKYSPLSRGPAGDISDVDTFDRDAMRWFNTPLFGCGEGVLSARARGLHSASMAEPRVESRADAMPAGRIAL